MSKNYSRRDFLRMSGSAAVSALALGITGAFADDAPAESVYTPGTYTASAKGHDGDVIVSVTFDETSITAVEIDASVETPEIGGAAAAKLQEQVMAAQSSAIDGFSGATETSRAVKAAVADCINQASGGKIVEGGDIVEEVKYTVAEPGDWLGEAPEIAEGDITDTLETEVLVVGAGNAGLMTAARAATEGAKVLVIEKAISCMTERHWLGAVDTEEAKAAGVVIDKNKLVSEICGYASHRCNEKLIRQWADNSGEAIDWYAAQVKKYNPGVYLHCESDVNGEDHGVYYVPATMHNFQDDIPEHDYSGDTAKYGLDTLSKVIADNGGEIMFSTPMIKLEQDGEKVTGVIAKNEAGQYIRINASKGVVLCTGGYPCNREMMAALNPDAFIDTVQCQASANDVGDGIRAAMWIGADKDPDPTAMLFDRGLIPPGQIPDGTWNGQFFQMGSQPWLKVNKNGERFVNESEPYDFMLHAGFMEPDHLYCTIFDNDWVEHVEKFHQFGCARFIPSPTGGKLQIMTTQVMGFILEQYIGAGLVQKADTLEELAEKLGLPVDTFVATVNRYNELCEAGEDKDFGKEAYRMVALKSAPYYGGFQGAALLTTLDGLRINTNMEVLDKHGVPIPGLYCAGDNSGGFFAHNYPEYVVGLAVGRSLTQGYLLGKALADK